MTEAPTELDPVGQAILAGAIGDRPETVMSVHQLRRGLCRALVLGPLERPRAAVTQAYASPAEPTAFGTDAVAVWTLLRCLEGWSAANVPLAIGHFLATLIEAETGRSCWLCDEIYFTLNQPVTPSIHPAVRRLMPADAELMERSAVNLDMAGWRFGSASVLLREGFAAGTVVAQQVVAVAFSAARADRYVGVGIVTSAPWRGRGLATSAAALVCAEIQGAGGTPVWSTSEENGASRRVADKLGFSEASRRVYVNRAEPRNDRPDRVLQPFRGSA
jgi:hypothetical protein